jgi:hypothetical protein
MHHKSGVISSSYLSFFLRVDMSNIYIYIYIYRDREKQQLSQLSLV